VTGPGATATAGGACQPPTECVIRGTQSRLTLEFRLTNLWAVRSSTVRCHTQKERGAQEYSQHGPAQCRVSECASRHQSGRLFAHVGASSCLGCSPVSRIAGRHTFFTNFGCDPVHLSGGSRGASAHWSNFQYGLDGGPPIRGLRGPRRTTTHSVVKSDSAYRLFKYQYFIQGD